MFNNDKWSSNATVYWQSNYSTWSLRAWLIFAHFDLDVEVIKLRLLSEILQDIVEYYASR